MTYKFVCLSLLILPVYLWGQTADTGAIAGTVMDASGGVAQRATVTATNLATGQLRAVATGGDGAYNIALLQPGVYSLQFSAEGFKTAEREGVNINVTETPVVDQTLEVGSRNDKITVQENIETIQTASSSLGTVVGQRSVTGLPLTTRNYTQILSLAAGVNAPVNNASAAGNGSQDVSVNGMDPSHNNYQMDGVSITPITAGQPQQGFYGGIGIPSPDALAEFKIQTSLYDAGYGRNPGANESNHQVRHAGMAWIGV
jgi:hypothetical protein